ncbi:uncharacterized protein EV154DRAFT_556944 [Mucor mucedo]|uniref:uncharacterized protein n=1 Tax=Mucor mucedo TaxID=29922 RepID=UPI00221FAEF1|nr:uncharacterized protein EV154DRAFT_556944 [Mucor mucedo]KAI7867632.1 hypothetical protein EV154DRAFT_556944 [Mucor mucedo]
MRTVIPSMKIVTLLSSLSCFESVEPKVALCSMLHLVQNPNEFFLKIIATRFLTRWGVGFHMEGVSLDKEFGSYVEQGYAVIDTYQSAEADITYALLTHNVPCVIARSICDMHVRSKSIVEQQLHQRFPTTLYILTRNSHTQ